MKLPKAKKMNLSPIFTSDQLKKDKEEGTSDKAYYNLCNKAYMQTLTTQWTKCVKEKNNRFQEMGQLYFAKMAKQSRQFNRSAAYHKDMEKIKKAVVYMRI